MNLTTEEALTAYAKMMNSLNASCLEPLLADDFRYASQWTFTEIESKGAYLQYIAPKLESLRGAESAAWAELGWLDGEFPVPCIILAQGDRDNLIGVVLATVESGKLKRLDLCGAPSPYSARRTGKYPGRKAA